MANGATISLSYVVQSDQFNKSMSDMKRNLKTMQTECANAAKEVDLYGNNITNLANKQSKIQAAIKQTEKIMQTYTTQLDKNKTSLADNQSTLAKLAAKKKELTSQYKNAVKVYGEESEQAKALKSSLEQVTSEYSTMSGKVKTNENNIKNYTTQLERQRGTLLDLQGQLQATNAEIEQQSNKFVQASEKFANYGSKLESIGGKIQDVGEVAMKAGTMILGAAGSVAKFASDFETSIAKVNSIAKLSKEELENYADAIMQVSNNTGQSAEDVANSVYEAISSGINVGDATGFVEQMNTLSASGFTSLSNAIDVVTTTINAYGMSAENATEISDKLITTQNLGKVTVDELSQSMGKIIPTANASNVSLDQLCTGYAVLTSQGIAAAESTTYMNSMFNELSDSGSKVGEILKNKTGKNFKELMESGMSLSDVLLIINESAKEQGLQFTEMWGSAEAGKAGLGLITEEGQKFNKVLGEMQNSTGATKEAFDTVSNTSAYKMQQSLTQLKNSFTKLGESLLPFVDEISQGIGSLAKIISNLNPEIVTSIAKFGALLLVFGGVTKGVGSLVTAVGKGSKALSALFKVVGNFKSMGNLAKAITSVSTAGTAAGTGVSAFTAGLSALSSVALPLTAVVATLAAGFYAWHEYNDAMTQSVTKSREEMSALEKVFADLTDTTTYSKKELEDMVLVYEDFSEDISPEFQAAVKDMRGKIQDLNMDLAVFGADDVWSSDETEQLKNNFNSGVDECIQSIKDKKEEVQKAWTESFLMDDGVIDEGEQVLLDFYNRQYDTSISEIEQMKADVNELFRKMIEEGYTLTPEDEQMIREYFAKINQIELECLAGNEEEQLFAKNKFKSQVEGLDAESASKVGKQRKKQLEDELSDIEAYYDTQIEMIEMHYDDMSDIEKAAADAELEQLRSQKDAKVKAKQEEINAVYDEIVKANPNLKGVIDRFTLEELEGASKKANDKLNILKKENADMLSETQTGTKKIWDVEKQAWEQVTTIVDESTGEVTGVIKTWVDENGMHMETAAGYNEQLDASTKTMGESMVQEFNRMKTAIEQNSDAYVDNSGNIVNANGQVIGSISQVIDENGNLVTSVNDVNGNPIDIKDNTKEAINNLDNTARKVNELDGKTATVKVALDKGNVESQIDWIARDREVRIKATGMGTFIKPEYGSKETGGSVNESGVYNTQEAGLELIDTASPSVAAYSLADATRGELTYIPANSKVTNAAMTTLKMKSMIDDQVKSTVSLYMAGLRKELVSALKENGGNGDFNITMNNPNFADKGSEVANVNNVKRIINSMK